MMDKYDICSGIKLENIEEKCLNNDIKVCILTSPTFEGIISDIAPISEFLHNKGILLIVDEAHGAHFSFASWLFNSAANLGGDIVIQSLHKTMPCINQCSIIHVNNKLDENLSVKVNKYLSIFQTSSPSYLMLANMEDAICWAISNEGQEEFNRYRKDLENFRYMAKKLVNIKLLDSEIADITRLVFFIRPVSNVKLVSGDQMSQLMEEKFGIIFEMSGLDYVVAISTVYDNRENFELLIQGLKYCDEYLFINNDTLIKDKITNTPIRKIANKNNKNKDGINNKEEMLSACFLEVLMPSEKVTISVEQLICFVTKGEKVIATNKHFIYPPGIPIINEGEEFNIGIVNTIIKWLAVGKDVRGINK